MSFPEPEKLVDGMAIPITIRNAGYIALVNKGVAPMPDWDSYEPSYFIMASDTFKTTILPHDVFVKNWKAADDNYPLNEKYLVDIVTI